VETGATASQFRDKELCSVELNGEGEDVANL
jgi:hypothetical protein